MVFSETTTYYYTVHPVTEANLRDPNTDFGNMKVYADLRTRLDKFERLDRLACINKYATQFLADRGDVILILDPETPPEKFNYTNIAAGDPFRSTAPPWNWMCNGAQDGAQGNCNLEVVRANATADNWQVLAADWRFMNGKTKSSLKVDHCLSQPHPQQCKLRFSLPLLVVVIIFNGLKALFMVLTLLSQRAPTLVTLGGMSEVKRCDYF